MTTLRVDEILALLADAAEAAIAALPTSPLLAGFAGEGTEPNEFVFADGRAAACRMRGLAGDLVLILSPEVAASVLDGPLGNQGLAAACEPAFKAAATVLDQAAPAAIRIAKPSEVGVAGSLDGAGSAFAFAAVPLFEDETHRASLALLLSDPAAGDEPADAEPVDMPSSVPAADVAQAAPYLPADTGGGYGLAPIGGVATMVPAHSLRLLSDVEMHVTAELGRTRMTVRNILGLTPGSVIELDRAAGSPVDLLVNGTLIARGEVVVIDEEFGVRISEIIGRIDDGGQ